MKRILILLCLLTSCSTPPNRTRTALQSSVIPKMKALLDCGKTFAATYSGARRDDATLIKAMDLACKKQEEEFIAAQHMLYRTINSNESRTRLQESDKTALTAFHIGTLKHFHGGA